MSNLRVTSLKGRTAGTAPTLPDGAVVTGVTTSTSFDGSGASLTNLNATQLASGTVPDARLPNPLPAISGANLTNLPESGDSNDITACLFI
tara:strand:- start:347 stop:619 length:273 start_codon:yes stop_codon:yes gene_type:complete